MSEKKGVTHGDPQPVVNSSVGVVEGKEQDDDAVGEEEEEGVEHHLFVLLQHGSHGFPAQFENIKKHFDRRISAAAERGSNPKCDEDDEHQTLSTVSFEDRSSVKPTMDDVHQPHHHAWRLHKHHRARYHHSHASEIAHVTTGSATKRRKNVTPSGPRAEDSHPPSSVTVWDTNVNTRLYSDAGTVTCGHRLFTALMPALQQWIADKRWTGDKRGDHHHHSKDQSRVKLYLSCIGHSWGGLVLREVLPSIIHSDWFQQADVQPLTFLTVASPHCGVMQMTPFLRFGGKLVGKVYSTTYQDLFLMNDVLLERLVSERHLSALEKFRHRLLYGNVHGDPLVSYSTSTLQYSSTIHTATAAGSTTAPAGGKSHRDPSAADTAGRPTPSYPHVDDPIALQPQVVVPVNEAAGPDTSTTVGGNQQPLLSSNETTSLTGAKEKGRKLPCCSCKCRSSCTKKKDAKTKEGAGASPSAEVSSGKATTSAGLADQEKGPYIAAVLQSRMPFTVFPVRHHSTLPIAHDGALGLYRMRQTMEDVPHHVVDSVLYDFEIEMSSSPSS